MDQTLKPRGNQENREYQDSNAAEVLELGTASAETQAPFAPIAEMQLGQPLPGLEFD